MNKIQLFFRSQSKYLLVYYQFLYQYSKSKMILKTVIGLLLAVALFTRAEGCQALTQISDFFSARAVFELPPNEGTSLAFNYQTYNITLPRKYDRSNCPQYAFALAEASALSASISYFDILVLKTFEASLVVNFIYEPGKWTRAAYNYWITFRSDLNLGIQSLSAAQITHNNNQFEIAYSMRRAAVPNKAAALVFLSGIRFDNSNGTEGHQLSFLIERQYIKDGQLVFTFTTNTTLQLTSLTFSFAVFDPHALPLASYGGVISSTNLAATEYKNLKYIVVPSTAYSIYGVSSIQASRGFTLSSNLLDNLTLTYGVNQWEQLTFLEITYVVIGQAPASVCLRNADCQASGQLIISGQNCVSSCPVSFKQITHSDGAVECIPCPPNMIYSNATKKCVCPSGFILQANGVCLAQTREEGVSYNRANAGDSLGASPSSASECLKIVNVQSNNKNLYITIQAGSQVLLDPQSHDTNYLRLTFADQQPSSYYCGTNNEDASQYTCLALYSSGIPTTLNIGATCKTSSSGTPCSANYSYSPTKPQ